MPSFRSGIQRAAGPRGGLKAHGPLYWQKPSTFSCWFFSGLRPQHPGRALQRSPKGRLGPVSPHLSPWCLTSRQGEESGHCLSRSSGPRLFFPGFFEVTPAAVTFPELSWVPLIHAWTGHRGRQWCGCCAPGSGDLGLACDSPGGWRSQISLLQIWVPIQDRRLGMCFWGSELHKGPVDLRMQGKSTQSCLSQGRVVVAPEECGSGPTAGAWRLRSGVISLNTVSSWGPGHTAQVRGAERASSKGPIPLGSRGEAGVLILVGRCHMPLPHPDFSWGLCYYLGE